MTVTQTPPPVVKSNGVSNGSGASGPQGPAGDGQPRPPARRNSVFPLLLDLGLVVAAFGLIIMRPLFSPLAGNVAIVVGVVLAVTALAGWIREARGEYLRLQD